MAARTNGSGVLGSGRQLRRHPWPCFVYHVTTHLLPGLQDKLFVSPHRMRVLSPTTMTWIRKMGQGVSRKHDRISPRHYRRQLVSLLDTEHCGLAETTAGTCVVLYIRDCCAMRCVIEERWCTRFVLSLYTHCSADDMYSVIILYLDCTVPRSRIPIVLEDSAEPRLGWLQHHVPPCSMHSSPVFKVFSSESSLPGIPQSLLDFDFVRIGFILAIVLEPLRRVRGSNFGYCDSWHPLSS